jgi:hypothetical protein
MNELRINISYKFLIQGCNFCDKRLAWIKWGYLNEFYTMNKNNSNG